MKEGVFLKSCARHPEETIVEKDMFPDIHGSTIYNSQDVEASSVSTDRGRDQADVVHIYDGILLSHKKE